RHTRSKRDWSSDVCSSDLTSVQQQASQAISDIQSIVDEYTTKLNDETEDKINQVNEESDKVIEAIKGNNVVTKDETDGWQKYKFTNDDGTSITLTHPVELNDDEYLDSLEPGLYYAAGPKSSPSGSSGF